MAMAKGIPLMGRGPDGKAKIINVDENGNVKVQLKGRIEALASERPAANTVDKGTVFWAVDTGEVWVSTGTEWRSLGVA